MQNDTSNEPKALVIPNAEQLQHDADLFAKTKEWIEWVGSVETGGQEATKEDKVNALTVIYDNVTALQHNNLISNAAVAGLKEAADKLREQRDEALAEGEQQWQEGYKQGIAEAEEYYTYGMFDELDPFETWDALKDHQGWRVQEVIKALALLGEADKVRALRGKYDLAVERYEDAARLINEHDTYLWEKRHEIAERKAAAGGDDADEDDEPEEEEDFDGEDDTDDEAS